VTVTLVKMKKDLIELQLTGGGARPEPAPPTGDITALRKGMTRADAERAFGRPAEISRKGDGDLAVTTLVFNVGDQRVTADFVEDILVRYTISSR
jgi:hypothetical protein